MKTRKRFNSSVVYILSLAGFLLGALIIYLISPDSRVSVLNASGNYYYSKQQILDLAKLDYDSRMILSPSFLIEKRLESNPLIDDASVSYNNHGLTVNVQEKVILGVYEQDGEEYYLCLDGTRIPADEVEGSQFISNVPTLSGFTMRQLEEIAGEFNRYSEYITRDTIEKIAEMVPWEESYDDSMIKMTMQDGNVVISSLSDLLMISKYQLLLTRLQGDHVCLFLDKTNSAIDKISCDYIYMSSEQREQYRKELREELERIQKEAEIEAQRELEAREAEEAARAEQQAQEQQANQDEIQQEIPEQPEEYYYEEQTDESWVE